jgi:hypothetical protein
MKTITQLCILLYLFFSINIQGQVIKETSQPLSKKASKGYLFRIDAPDNGGIEITYKIPGDKKKEEVFFEKYKFDHDLAYGGSEAANIAKTEKPNKIISYFYTVAGGCSSFDVLSMKLKLNKRVIETAWSDERQRYIYHKQQSSETMKAKNDNGKVYMGCASYTADDDHDGIAEEGREVFNLVRLEGSKGKSDEYFVLMIDNDLQMRELPLNMQGEKTLVYTSQLENHEIVAVFAPRKGAADIKKYTYFLFSDRGVIMEQCEFNSPAAALLISSAFFKNGSVYFCGNSKDNDDPYEKTFTEFASINNPCYTNAANYQDEKWQKASEGSMDNFHFLKFTGNKLDFSSTTPVKNFKSKLVTSPEDKGADSYKGRKFDVNQFYITQQGEFIVSGQLTGRNNLGDGNIVKSYEDVVCLHFDNAGNLKAQYGVKKMNSDKKSEIFTMPQRFIPSADGFKLYWEILEVKGKKGYASFADAYNGSPTFYPLYFPRLIQIDLNQQTVSKSSVLGKEKFFVRGAGMGIWNEKERSMLYIGHDDDFETLWTAKVKFD